MSVGMLGETIIASLIAALALTGAADVMTPVRRGGVEGRPYWNAHSIMFMYPPAFGFAKVDGAVKYRFDVLDDVHETLSFVADSPEADLSPVWPKLRVGYATVTVTGVGADGRDLGVAGRRTFWRKAEFREGAYPKAKFGYDECAGMIYCNLFSGEDYQPVLRNRKMAENVRSRYPAKMLSALIEGMVRFAEIDAARRTDALKMARNAADILIGYSEKADARYSHFPPTYSPDKYEANYEWPNRRKCMTLYPADAAHAYLTLYDAVKDEKYLTAAKGVAETYLAFQGKDGTWPLTVDFDQGPFGTNRLIPLRVVTLFERLFALTGEAKYRTAGDRAFGYVEKTLIATWNWEGQFEDTPPTERYKNLTKHPACDTALYLLARYPGDKERLALARELLRFAEDQFVNWERPFGDGKRPPDPKTFTGYFNHFWDQDKWIMPSVFEQYGCYTPVDASAAKLIRTYLALYRAEGNPLDLAKACALGDTATRCTSPDGLEATWWTEGQLRDDIWPNCMFATAAALTSLADEIAIGQPQLSPIFADGMVIAEKCPVRVFGTGKGEVRVAFRGHEARTTAAGEGAWCVELPAGEAGGPFELRVSLNGRERVVRDVHVGLVILCAGQSNMQFKLIESDTPREQWRGDSRIRSFSTEMVEEGEPFSPTNGWVALTRENAGRWSAIAYETATRLAAERKVAVGVVNCYQGASTIQAWMDPRESSKSCYRIPEGGALHGDHTAPRYSRWNQPHGTLYRRQFRPLVPYAFSGVVWYQGESNTGRREGETYAALLGALMRGWREDLREGDLPFVVVQIADFKYRDDDDWRAVQRAQVEAVRRDPYARLVRSADISDSGEIHPKEKGRLSVRIADALLGGDTMRFSNPISKGDAADPFVTYDKVTGYYYGMCTESRAVVLRRARQISQLFDEGGWKKVIFRTNAVDGVYGCIWAPEMHKAPDGKWYVYTSGNTNPDPKGPWDLRIFALQSKTADPYDGFVFKGILDPDTRAIDPTVWTDGCGRQYMCYSFCIDGGQRLGIRRLRNPWTFEGPHVDIAKAELPWEMTWSEQSIVEGPFFLESKGRLFIVYSANGCWNDDYALGVLEHTGGDILSATQWKKHEKPLLVKGNGVFGPGHASFFHSPDGTEVWCAYHGMNKSNPKHEPTTRYCHIQKVNFTKDGFPVMGTAIGASK